MKQRGKVELGQHYQSVGTITGTPVFTYRVVQLFQSKVDNVEYARLAQVGEPSRSKSVAAAVLLNPRHFLPVVDTAAATAAKTVEGAERAA
jgi:hypothetical protein